MNKALMHWFIESWWNNFISDDLNYIQIYWIACLWVGLRIINWFWLNIQYFLIPSWKPFLTKLLRRYCVWAKVWRTCHRSWRNSTNTHNIRYRAYWVWVIINARFWRLGGKRRELGKSLKWVLALILWRHWLCWFGIVGKWQ